MLGRGQIMRTGLVAVSAMCSTGCREAATGTQTAEAPRRAAPLQTGVGHQPALERRAAEAIREKTMPAPRRGRARAVRVEKGPAIDGTMKDPAWKKAEPWPIGPCTSDSPPKYPTRATVLFDDGNVYVGVFCSEPDTDRLVKSVTARDGEVWRDDSVEVFVRADPEKPYYQFVVNPLGALLDVACASPSRRSVGWNSTAEAKASVAPGESWTATVRIPMKEIGAFVGKDQTWAMNVYRTRPARGADGMLEYSWSVMSTNDYHSPMDFGTVEGIEVPLREDGVTRTRAAPAPKAKTFARGTPAGGVTVYREVDFDDGLGGFAPSGKARLSLTSDSAGGKALLCVCEGKWAGPQLSFDIAGSKDLRMAFLAKGKGFPRAWLNVHDQRAGDNTTSYSYRFLPDGKWTPVLYYLDRFRYNSRMEGFVAGSTAYTGVRFYGPEPRGETTLTLDNFVIYRGRDAQPPERVTGLEARATAKGVELSWRPADDNVAAMLYVVSRAEGGGPFVKVAEVCVPRCRDETAGKGTYRYRVLACDFEENLGPWSEVVLVRAVAEAKPSELTREEKDRLGYAEHLRRVHESGRGKVRKGHVCFFGDSLTAASVYPRAGQGALGIYTAASHGFASMMTSFGRSKVGEILDRENPEFLLVIYGTNNLGGRRAPKDEELARWMSDMEAIARAGEARGTVVLFGTVPPRGFSDPESRPEMKYNRTLAELGRRLHVPVAYIFRDIQAAGERSEFIAGDGVHWKSAGMELAAKAWAKAMEQVRWVLRDRP